LKSSLEKIFQTREAPQIIKPLEKLLRKGKLFENAT